MILMITLVESVSKVSYFSFSSEKKLCFKIQEINKQAQTK